VVSLIRGNERDNFLARMSALILYDCGLGIQTKNNKGDDIMDSIYNVDDIMFEVELDGEKEKVLEETIEGGFVVKPKDNGYVFKFKSQGEVVEIIEEDLDFGASKGFMSLIEKINNKTDKEKEIEKLENKLAELNL